MGKKEFRSTIYALFEKFSYRCEKDAFFKDAEDGSIRIVVSLSAQMRGFLIGLQFPDFGAYDGDDKNCKLKCYDFELDLLDAISMDYDLLSAEHATKHFLEMVEQYVTCGKNKVVQNIDHWTFALFDDAERNRILAELGIDPIDPYAEEYLREQADRIKGGGCVSIPIKEYFDHKEFYDCFQKYSCSLTIDNQAQRVFVRPIFRAKPR